jgi:alkanesulfonate monooxygenase SsuD/methylene tetrahydromethanopterin reductase-like flavin-dependent oxidoreductase (luciferase family)
LCGTVEQVVDELGRYAEAGADRAMLLHLAHEDTEMVHLLGEVAARIAEPAERG